MIGYFTNHSNHVINTYGSDVFKNSVKNSIIKYLCKKALHSSKHIISISDRMTEFLVHSFSIPIDKITTIQYGINLDLFKTKTDITKRPYDFIANRLFVTNSNYELILENIRKLQKEKKDIKLLIVGSGPLKNHIVSFIKKHNLEKTVTLMDAVSEQKMVELLNSAKIFLSFNSSDGTPLSLFEALACGLYPVLSDIEAYKEWRHKGMQCELVSLHDGDGIIKGLKLGLKNASTAIYRENNITLVRNYMDYHKNMSYIEQLFRKMIA